MSFSLSSIFGSGGGIAHGPSGATAAPVQQVTTNPGDQPDNTSQTVTTAKSADSPLDKFNGFWQTATNADGSPVAAPVDPMATPIFTLDPVKVTASAAKLNFTSGIDQSAVTEAFGDKAPLLMDMLNTVGRQAFVAGTLNTGSMVEHGVKSNNNRFTSTLPKHIKEVQLSQTETTNPVLSHPAAAPLVSALKTMAFAKNPNMSPAEVTSQVEALLVGLGTAMADATPEAKQKVAAANAGETDWSTFL